MEMKDYSVNGSLVINHLEKNKVRASLYNILR